MFNVRVYLTNACLACFDLGVTGACYFVTRPRGLGNPLMNAALAASILIVWLVLSFHFGMYRSRRLDSPLADFVILLKVSFSTWVLVQAASTVVPLNGFSPTRFLIINFLALAFTRSALRVCLREFRRRGYNVKELAVIASREVGRRLEEKIATRSHYGYRVVQRFDYPESGNANGFVEQVREFLQSRSVHDVILALPARATEASTALVEECESQGINIRIVPDLLPLVQLETQVYDLDGIPLINARRYPTEFFEYVVLKRIFDLCVSVLLLAALSPLFLVLSILIKWTSPGPVFFTQDRVGMNGKRFRIIKFRTMRQEPSLNPDSHWTVHNDRFVTPLGRWLRRTNVDELPQLLNVVKGEMSLVGPRPERPFFLERFRREVPEYMARHYVKCGITGWAQVNGWRGDTPIPQRVAHDLFYIRNWAVSFDIKILFLTLARLIVPGTGSLHREKTES